MWLLPWPPTVSSSFPHNKFLPVIVVFPSRRLDKLASVEKIIEIKHLNEDREDSHRSKAGQTLYFTPNCRRWGLAGRGMSQTRSRSITAAFVITAEAGLMDESHPHSH